MRFLIILKGSVGDVTRGLILPQYIKRAFPDSTIAWLVEPLSAPLVELNPHVDQVIVFERKKGVRGIPHVVRLMRSFNPDITLDLQRHIKSGFFSFLSHAKRRIGFHPVNTKEGNHIFNNEYIEEATDALPKLEHYLLFLKKLNIPFEYSAKSELKKVSLSSEIEVMISSAPIVSLIMGSTWETKDWPLSGYAGLIKKIKEDNPTHHVLLVGTKAQSSLAERLVSPGVYNLCGKTKLSELPQILKASKVVIGPDSGPGHISSLVGVPYVSLFGPTSAERTAPYGYEDIVVAAQVPCRPCYRKKCPGLDKVCMRLISPEQVYSAAKKYL